jgi:hypothetical protein
MLTGKEKSLPEGQTLSLPEFTLLQEVVPSKNCKVSYWTFLHVFSLHSMIMVDSEALAAASCAA